MKLLIKKNKVSDFCIYLNNEVTVVDGVLTIGEKSYSHNENESVFSENGVLYEYLDSSIFVFDGNSFVKKKCEWSISYFFDSGSWIERDRDEEFFYAKYFENEEEKLRLQIPTKMLLDCRWRSEDVLVLNDVVEYKTIYFYSKSGEKLWEYKVEEPDVKIEINSILVVDNVVIICCNRRLRKHSVEGFNIHTGEKIWGYYGDDVRCGRNYMAAADGMVYGIYMRESEKDREKVLLCVEKIDPISGVSDLYIVKEDTRYLEVYQWLATISDMKLYYSDARPGCSIGVVDLKTMSLIDDCHLQLKKAGSYGLEKPIVIGDKVYAYSRETEELFVFEK